MPEKLYENLEVGKPEKSEIQIKGEVPADILMRHFEAVLEDMRREFEAPGFRKGNVPLHIFRSQVHEHRVLEDAAELALQEAYPAIIDDNKLDVVGRPEVTITKLAAGNPLGFTITVGVKPEFKLPDYKKIGAAARAARKPLEVTESEIDEVVMTLRRLRAPGAESASDSAASTAPAPAEAEGAPSETPVPPSDPEDAPGNAPAPQSGATDALSAPELTDDFVKTLGNFENVADFRAKLTENIRAEKEQESRRALREDIAKHLVEAADIHVPSGLIQEEAETMQAQMEADLSNAGLSFEDYLKRSGKTAEGLAEEHRQYAERQLKTRFILERIAEAEGLQPDEAELETETKLMAERYPDLDRDRIRRYLTRLMVNEKVLALLENGPAASKEALAKPAAKHEEARQ